MAFCPYCGHALEANAAYCPACGQRVATASGAASAPPAPPYPGSPSNLRPPPSIYGEADKQALSRLWIASLVFLASFVVSYAVDFALNPFRALVFVTPSTTGTVPNISFSPAFYTYLDVSLAIGAITEVVALLLVWSCFRKLGSVDRSHFRIPAILTLVLLVGLPLALIGASIIFSSLPTMISAVHQQQASGATTPNIPTAALGSMLSGLGLIGLGGLIALIGLIGGIMLGLWRVGERYDNTLIKISAILIIIPVLDIVVPLLMMIGVWQSRKKLSSLVPPPSIPPIS
ncbi:MAG TPA: zinc ribbon domain-containing protein [Nitrososphaerales archaeon]|nr:zinc ribbon domain-containing protein [Nitrososphaerales archaeon]